jgi:diaminopimelate epimerase
MGKIPFVKMHGLGNDFVVLDGRRGNLAINAAEARVLADRRIGVGCDQVIVLERPRNPAAQIMMRICNADGGEAEACGNATRCVAELVKRETGDRRVLIETIAGLLEAEAMPDGCIAVDMGRVRSGWREIPLACALDTDHVEQAGGRSRLPALWTPITSS